MLKRKNDRQPQSMEELYPDDYWLDEEDGEEELPVPEMKRKPVSGRLHDEPMVTGYEALERQRCPQTEPETDTQGKESPQKGTEI